jgi:hypothetical protein
MVRFHVSHGSQQSHITQSVIGLLRSQSINKKNKLTTDDGNRNQRIQIVAYVANNSNVSHSFEQFQKCIQVIVVITRYIGLEYELQLFICKHLNPLKYIQFGLLLGFWSTVAAKLCAITFNGLAYYTGCTHVYKADKYCSVDRYYCELLNGTEAFCIPNKSTIIDESKLFIVERSCLFVGTLSCICPFDVGEYIT